MTVKIDCVLVCIDWWDFIFPWRPLFNAIFLAENSFGLLLKGGETDNKTFWWDYRGAFFHGFLSLGEWSRSGLVNPLRKCENYIRDSHEKRLFCAILVFFTFFGAICDMPGCFIHFFCICYIYRPCSKLTTQKSIDMSSASSSTFALTFTSCFLQKKSRERGWKEGGQSQKTTRDAA